jgi:undecaprenyl phosphate-alpha-L-ara4N flippase subunit ArnE
MRCWTHAILLSSSLCAAAGQMMLKQGATGRTEPLQFVNLWIAGGLVLYALGTVLWVGALSNTPLTVVYPYTALTFVIVYLSGALVFGEMVPARAVAGAAIVLIGLLLINLR